MIPPAAILTPHQAANVLQLSRAVKGIACLRVLLHMIAHPGPHTSQAIGQHLEMRSFMVWTHLQTLIEIGAVVVAGKEHVHAPTGAKSFIYEVRGPGGRDCIPADGTKGEPA